jgi:hypothetical protein
MVGTGEVRDFYQSPVSESALGCAEKSRVNMVLG